MPSLPAYAVRRRKGRPFIKGPVDLEWIQGAASAGGKALEVALEIWRLRGLKCADCFKINLSRLQGWGVTRSSGSRAIKVLEAKGLISTVKRPGNCIEISLRLT